MRITIEDVAREADVSIATVSRFLNGRAGQMSAATRDRVEAVVERLGYVPDSAARSLKTRRSRLLGVALADVAHMYWGAVLAGIEAACLERGYGVVISSAGNDAAAQIDAIARFLQQRVDGLLLNPTSAEPTVVAGWAALDCPVIMLDRTFPELSYPLVASDGRAGARIAVEHLVARGHRDIAFVGWELAGLGNRQERLDGYRAALAAAGLPVRADRIRFARESWDDGVNQTKALFASDRPPTAIFSATMELNLQVLAALKQLGVRVPAAVSVVGFDAAPWDDLLDPPLTTVAAPARDIGRLAANLLLAAIARGEPLARREHRIRPELVIRASTGIAHARGKA
ncbi:MAG TPA: LacI family DNA-binding transcriptional regulator [Thermomicrobiales bacterium]|nr:LacI family DNA-binding transcriptional regulator [Thermomicrobiales bacterium]